MKTSISCWTLVALTLLAGCLPSLNPIYTEQQLVFDSKVLGVWVQDKSQNKWEFTREDEKTYRMVLTDGNGQQSRFTACLANIEGTLFLDLFPEEIEFEASGFYKFHLVPIHTVYLVRRTEPNLELAAIDFKWLDRYLADHPDSLPFAKVGARKVLTAPTKELQAFVLKHKEMFTGDFQLLRPAETAN